MQQEGHYFQCLMANTLGRDEIQSRQEVTVVNQDLKKVIFMSVAMT